MALGAALFLGKSGTLRRLSGSASCGSAAGGHGGVGLGEGGGRQRSPVNPGFLFHDAETVVRRRTRA